MQTPGQDYRHDLKLLQALVRERMNDWGQGLCKRLNKKMVELTGDYTPDLKALLAADIIICTPEKWDGISRNWQNRSYVTKVCLVVIDEIHLLGADRWASAESIGNVVCEAMGLELCNHPWAAFQTFVACLEETKFVLGMANTM